MWPFRHDLHYLTGVYALDAVSDVGERTRFEHHLRRCQQCANEVRGMSETATRLAFAASLVAPPQLRDRVLAAVSRTRQLPPRVDDHRSSARPRPVDRPRLAWVAAAACLVAAVVLAVALLNVQRELNRSRAEQRQIAIRQAAIERVLDAPDARAITGATARGGTATVVFSLARHSMIVTTSGLPSLPADKTYQLWLIGPPHTRSAGLLVAGRNGRLAPKLVAGLVKGDEFGVTVEPADGTSQPTTTPIVVLKLAR